MKRVLLFTLLISFIGYSQNTIQPNHQNFNDNIPQYVVEKMNSVNFELGDDEMDFNPTQMVSDVKLQSLQSEMNNQSDNGIIYRLDGYTDVYVGSEDLTNKYTRSYNENGDLTLYISYNWDSESQSFIPSVKYEYTYDENGNETLNIRFYWDSESQSFEPQQKYEKTFDENGNCNFRFRYYWNTDSQSFIPNKKEEYTYNENRIQSRIDSDWSTESQSYVPTYKNESFFDDLNRQIIVIFYSYDSNSESFIPDSKDEYTYDENGNRTSSSLGWNSVLEIFVPNYKESLEYDEQERVSFRKNYSYDICNEEKYQTSQYQYIYDDELDGSNLRTFTLDSNGDWVFEFENGKFYDENGLLVRHSQNVNLDRFPYPEYIWSREYSYDTEGNNIEEILSKWDTQTESLVLSEKELRVYDYDFHPRYLTQFRIEKYFPGLGFKPSFEKDFSIHSETDTELVIVGTIKQYDTNFNTWSELQGEEFRSYWYYTKTPSLSTSSVESNLFSIYPNPTSSTLQINSSEYLKTPMFELYDVKGSKILSSPFKLTEPIDVSDLQPSMYIYNVKDGSEVKQSGKVLIE